MEIKEENEAIKISMPLISNQELQDIENYKDDLIENFVNSFVHKKELLIAQELVRLQKKELEELKQNSIPKQKIQDNIEKLEKLEKMARECIERKLIIADSDSLNYGRAEAHSLDKKLLQELLKED